MKNHPKLNILLNKTYNHRKPKNSTNKWIVRETHGKINCSTQYNALQYILDIVLVFPELTSRAFLFERA